MSAEKKRTFNNKQFETLFSQLFLVDGYQLGENRRKKNWYCSSCPPRYACLPGYRPALSSTYSSLVDHKKYWEREKTVRSEGGTLWGESSLFICLSNFCSLRSFFFSSFPFIWLPVSRAHYDPGSGFLFANILFATCCFSLSHSNNFLIEIDRERYTSSWPFVSFSQSALITFTSVFIHFWPIIRSFRQLGVCFASCLKKNCWTSTGWFLEFSTFRCPGESRG